MVSVVERSSSGSFDEVIGAVETDDFGLVLGIALGIVAVALLVNFIVTILIWNPLEVGCKKLFIQCEYGTAETRCYLVGDQQERYVIEEISRSLGKFLGFGLGIIYIMVLVPGTVVLAGTLTNRGSDKVTREKQGQP